jgi:hypothetical protein
LLPYDRPVLHVTAVDVDARQLLELLAEHTQRSDTPIPIAMEAAKGLFPASLGAAGYQLFPINPLAVSRYRDRCVVSRAKSDPGDAFVRPASCVPTWPRIAPCPPTASSSAASGSWRVPSKTRSGSANRRRTSCAACCASTTPPSWPPLRTWPAEMPGPPWPSPPHPPQPKTAPQLSAGRAGAFRAPLEHRLPGRSDPGWAGLRGEQFTQLPLVEQGMGHQALAHLRALNTAVANVAELEQVLGETFAQHPDAAIITSFPGLGTVLGARIIGEISDDRTRFADAKALKAFAGTGPITRASGLKRSATMRIVRARRLCHAGYLWTLPCSPTHPEAARTTTNAANGATPTSRRPTPHQPLLRDLVPLPPSASATTKPRPSHPPPRSRLDFYRRCDVSDTATMNSVWMSTRGIGSGRPSPNSHSPFDHSSTAIESNHPQPTQHRRERPTPR